MSTRFVAVVAAALFLGGGSIAGAQQATPAPAPTPVNLPSPAPRASLDPYARAAIDLLTGVVRQQLQGGGATSGEVTYFKRFEMQVQTGNNAYRAIHLHQGTVINPRGASIATGQRVNVTGVAQPDGSLSANVVTINQ